MKVCDHPQRPILVHLQLGESDREVTVSEIRAAPSHPCIRQYRYCWDVARGDQCRYGSPLCSFPHSEVEMAVWTAERNDGLDRNDLLWPSTEQGQEPPPEPGASALQPNFHCSMCQLQFSSQDGFVSHCSSLAHERRVCEDRAHTWQHRHPPEITSHALQLCDRPETCEYGDNCTAAHSIQELQEWCLRKRMAHRRRKATHDQSYQDSLLMEYRDSLNEVLIRPLLAVALLKQEPGATFTLGDPCGDPCLYSEGGHFCTVGMTYVTPVSFTSTHPGRYEQWLVLDFDSRPVLLRKLRVGVGLRASSPEPTEETQKSTSPSPVSTLQRAVPWHGGNRVTVPCLDRTKAEEELLKEYKPPRLNLTFNPTAEGDLPLTLKNYRERMHMFLYREELAQEKVLSRLSLQTAVVSLSDSICESQFKMRIAPARTLYAEVPMSHILTPDMPGGLLLRKGVHCALLALSPSLDNRVYEALVLSDVCIEDRIYLQLSERCCSDLDLQKGTTHTMEIQFQLDRIPFCHCHRAVDLLPDVERVLPDLSLCGVQEIRGEHPELNPKQRAAMALIVGDVSGPPSVAPVLIYGPFGTGKTFTLARAAKEILKQPGTRLLICTHTNSAADLYVKDHFHEYVQSGHSEARPLRVKAGKKGLTMKATDKITLQYCLLSQDNQSFLLPKRSVLDSYQLIITTAMMARHLHDLKLPSNFFTHILIDEASQMLECAALMPLGLAGSKTRVVLAGDHMQMGPKLCSVAEGRGSDHTLLNRLFHYYQGQEGSVASRSRVIFCENYRSTKEIVDFVSTHFYVGKTDVIRARKQFRAILMTTVHTRESPFSCDTVFPGFFGDARVLNTAMTRAQSQVVAVGDAAALCCFGKCSKIWKSYINECISKGSALPEHLTMDYVEQEMREISRFTKTEEYYCSDTESSVSGMNDIEDPILKELLDESNNVQVIITEEGLLDIRKSFYGDLTEIHKCLKQNHGDISDPTIELKMITEPNIFKRCELIMETFDSGFAIPVDQPTLRIRITGRENVGRSFPGDQVVVEILSEEDFLCEGRVVGVLQRANRSALFVCTIDKYDPKVMTPINKCVSKIFTPFMKNKPNHVAVRKHENGCWIPEEYLKINEHMRQNHLFVVKVLKWVESYRYPLGVVTKVLPGAAPEKDRQEVLNIEYQLSREPPQFPKDDIKIHLKNRKDFRDYTTFTIDKQKSKDLDDAISVRDLDDHYEIGIHITDVASFVIKGSETDKHAEEQGNVYCVPDGETAHLFSNELRAQYLSLLPKCERRAISLIVVIEKKSDRIVKRNFFLSLVKSNRQMTYEEAESFLQSTDWGKPLKFDTVEDCLAVAYHFSEVHKRDRMSGSWHHAQPDETTHLGMGMGMSHDMLLPMAAEFRKLLQNAYTLRSNSTPQSKVGHHNLQLDSYTWASSPMRRYMDVIVQRLLHSVLEENTSGVMYTPKEIDLFCALYMEKSHGVTTKVTNEKASKQSSYIQINFHLNHYAMENKSVFPEEALFTVELIPKKLPYVLREHAIANLVRSNTLVKNIALGKIKSLTVFPSPMQHFGIEDTHSRELPPLNKSQNEAIKKALERQFTLIQGPPGTGKTVVGIHIVYWFFKMNKEHGAAEPNTHTDRGHVRKNGILYCGPSNKSVDIVAEQLLKLKDVLSPLRVYSDQIEMLEFPYPGSHLKVCRKSLREEKPNRELSSITLRYLIREPANPFSDQIKAFDDRIKNGDLLCDGEIERYQALLNEARQHELLKHDVILCTCAAAADPNFLKTMNFRQILIDECAMATEPEALIPLAAHRPEQVVLLGDHKQIQPIVQCDLVRNLGMKTSLFKRYMDEALMLDTQYRMHESICKFPSEEFYKGNLKTEAKREPSFLLNKSRDQTPILFGHVEGKEMTLVISTEKGNENSTANLEEAKEAVRIAGLLISQSGIDPTGIAILTPYNAQVSKINEILSEKGIANIAVTTIMKSQGSEWRYVILSTVRSCPRAEIEEQGPRPTKKWLTKKLGFVTDPNQVNVGITRAQDGLCIIGNQHLLKCNALWKKLLNHYQDQNCVVDSAREIQVLNPKTKLKHKRRK
ncbi:hypothetical protein MATL_G00145460 [Megalops atlanticus]|uniref:C3H1-type domain-containing protein n=1 Tax=Megalops atlanticus TaxID=7932 RepID=A0A9D3PZE0_MEGAT|nr:hypothetical protein MATL_G00145460 [Megalops atlanticus]